MVWRLFDRKERTFGGKRCFYERWVEPVGKSGIVFYSYPSGGRVLYVVEGYGIGTVSPKTFKEISGIAPIQTYKFRSLNAALRGLDYLKAGNLPSCSSEERKRLAEKLRLLPQIGEGG